MCTEQSQATGQTTICWRFESPCSTRVTLWLLADASVKYFLEGAVVSYIVTLSSDSSAVTFSNAAVVKADGLVPGTTDCSAGGSPFVIPAGGATVQCTFTRAITAGEVTAATPALADLSVEVLDGTTGIQTGSVDRSSIKAYRPGLSVVFDSTKCGSAPTMPGKQVQPTGT